MPATHPSAYSPYPVPTVQPVVNAATAFVDAGFASAQGYAQEAFSNAQNFLGLLNGQIQLLTTLPQVNTALGTPTTALYTYTPVDPAVEPTGFDFVVPPTPNAAIADVDEAIAGLTPLSVAPDAPAFTKESPTLTYPSLPTAFTGSAPVAPIGSDVLTDVAIPDAPAVVIPDVPTLTAINVPLAPLLSLPTFTPITVDYPSGPAQTFSFAEPGYTSTLLASLKAKLLEWVDGAATGIAAAVEQAIWSRGRARDIVAANKKAQEALSQFATRGFTKPPGALAVELLDAEQELQNATLTNSRDVMIKQADLEQSNRRFAFEQAWKTEEGLIVFNNNVAQRAFEAAKVPQQIALDIYQRVTERYSADIQKYAVAVDKWKASIQFELSRLEEFKAQLEGQRLIGQLNVQQLEVYKTRIEAIKTTIDVFRAQVEGQNVIASINKTKIDAYAARVGAYAETVRAKAAEYDAYATGVKAEVSKVDGFRSEVEAFAARINAYRAKEEARAAVKNSEIRVNAELPLELVKSRTTVFQGLVEAEAQRIKILNDTFSARVREVEVAGQLEAEQVRSSAQVYSAEVNLLQATAQVRIEAARANLQSMLQQISLVIESLRTGAQISSQLAASALSAVNLSAGISTSANNSASQSASSNASVGANVSMSAAENYSYTP